MAFRNIYIANRASLSIHHEQLIIETDIKYTVPLEDIATLLLENLYSQITAYALSKCSEYNITVFICDEKHIPCGILQPFSQHSRQLSVLNRQIEATQPFKNRMWQQIVSQKIHNQGTCLEILGKYSEADYLYALSQNIVSGDKDNKESTAARYYFKVLYGKTFTRDKDIGINAALNYGYAIVRGAVARAIAYYGFQPSLGIWHHSELNAFNLVDDFIEPLRPLVDLWVACYQEELEDELTPQNKEMLIGLLGYDMSIDQARHTIHNVADKMVKSYVTALQQKSPYATLLLPQLIPLQEHQYE